MASEVAEDAKGFTGFSMAPKGVKRPVVVGAAVAKNTADDDDQDDAPKIDLVEELIEGKVDVPSEGPKVISGQGNTFQLGGAQHLRAKLDATAGAGEPLADEATAAPEASGGGAVAEAEPANCAEQAKGGEGGELSEDAIAAQAILDEVQLGGSSTIFDANDDTERYRLDVATRADEATADEYTRMPIEDFGKAYLRGYDWEEGAGLGKDGKGAVEPIEYVPRPQLLGLGEPNRTAQLMLHALACRHANSLASVSPLVARHLLPTCFPPSTPRLPLTARSPIPALPSRCRPSTAMCAPIRCCAKGCRWWAQEEVHQAWRVT